MVSLAVVVIYVVGLILVVLFSLAGKINLGLLFLIPLLPLRNVIDRLQAFPLGKDIINIVLIAMLIGWFFKSRKNFKLEYTPLNYVLIFFIIYTFISLCLGSLYLQIPLPFSLADERLQNWKNYIMFPIIFFIVLNNVKSIKDIKRLIFFMAMAVLLIDYYTLMQIRWMSGPQYRDRINGTFSYLGPNELAAFLGSYIFVFFGTLPSSKIITKILFAISAILGFFCVVFLYSRGAYIGVIAALIVISLINKKILLIPIAALLLFWQSFLPQTVIDRISETKTEEGTLDVSSQTRLDIWKVSLDLFYKNPLTGVGYNVIPYVDLPGGLHDTHNLYLKILAEEGLVGIIIILMLFRYALMYGWRLYKTANDSFLKGLGVGFIMCVVSLMVSNLFGDRWTHTEVGTFFWVFLALVVRGCLIACDDLKDKLNPVKTPI